MDLEAIKLKIRKNKDIIYTNGYGLLVFIFWSLIKLILYLVDVAPYVSPGVDDELDIIYSYTTLFSSLLECVVIFVTGIIAIRVGKKDKPYRISLIILSIVTCLLSIDFTAFDIWICASLIKGVLSTVLAGAITDVFFFTVTLFLAIASIKLYRLDTREKEFLNHER